MGTRLVTGITDVFAIGIPVGVGTRAGTMVIGQRRAHNHPIAGKIKGQHFCHLSIPANDRQLKQISKTMQALPG